MGTPAKGTPAEGERHIIAIGGGDLLPESSNIRLEKYILEVSGKSRPRVAFVPTARGDSEACILRFYQTYSRLTPALSHLGLFRRAPADLRDFVFSNDVIYVGGGNTKSMLAVWREYALDTILREAWERGIVLSGSSAGSICWFQEGVTDSTSGSLTRLECLGFLPGSNCPHYDTEEERRPAYRRLMRTASIAAGYAADEGVGLHFVNSKLYRAVSARPESMAYRLARVGGGVREIAIPMSRL